MANYSTLKAAVADVVKTNGTQAITGANLQAVLLSIINSVGGGGYIFKGVATPSTDAGTPDENVFYIGGAGTYANFGTSVTVPVGSIGVFKYNGSWAKEQIALFAGIDDVPTAGSDNLVKSGGIFNEVNKLESYSVVPTDILTNSSPYHIDTLTGAYINNGVISSNQYTTGYRIALYRVPAGSYILKPMRSYSAGMGYVGLINSESDFVVGGTLSQVLLYATDYPTEKVVTFDSESLMVVVYNSTSYYNLCKVFTALPASEQGNNAMAFTHNGLLGVNKNSRLSYLSPMNSGDIISIANFSQFFLDMKIIGTPESDTEYMFDYFQQRIGGSAAYENYIRISKSSNNWSSKTTVSTINVGGTSPAGMVLHEITPTNSTLTKIYLLLNWGALANCNKANTGYYNIPLAYKFSMDYMQNMDYGIIPNILSSRNAQNIPALIQAVEDAEDAVYKNVVTNIDRLSPYYVDEIRDAYMASPGVITRNQYTSIYCVALFKLPAGIYQADSFGSTASRGVLVGKIDSMDDFVVGGQVSHIYLNQSSSPQSVEFTLTEETLVLVLGNLTDYFNYYCAIGSVVKIGCEEQIEQIFKVDLDIVIPDIVYAIVGTELNIWNDTISLSVDKGLYSPANYSVRWSCSKGLVTDRCFRYTPAAGDVGNVSCTCYLYDMRGVQVTSKQFTIKVVAKNALSSSKNIVYFGDSLGQAAATALYNNFHNNSMYTGTIPTMLGTVGSTNHYEAVGGYKWSSYATAGSDGYRIFVTNVTAMSVGAVYSDGSHHFQVYEVNITNGTGNCLLGKYYTNEGALIMPSGTLTKISGSGDSSVPYTGAYQESANPLWNDTTHQLDIAQYKQTLVNMGQLSSTSAKIDAVSFQFGINDNNLANNLSSLKGYITDLYNAFIGDNANCKFIVGLTTSSGNDVNGAGVNNGATNNTNAYLKNTYTIRKYYLSLLSEFPNMRIATPNLYLDRYYGYGFSTRQISSRYTETEQYHNNYVHPASSGYAQMGDAYFAAYVAVLTE